MNDLEISIKSQGSVLSRFWSKTPIILRAVLTGFIVNSIGVGTWVLVIMFLPGYWGLVFMGLFLWAYVRYFSGSWWPRYTSEFRKVNFRETKLSRISWQWGLISAVLFVLVFQSGLMVTFRFIEYPAEIFKSEYNLDALPLGYAWIGLIMASLVAGICEETGFRGYMQVPLEKKYGAKVAISVVSVVFVLVHLHQAWAWPILFQILAAGLFMGILAFRTGSLIPGIIAHTILDIFNFSYWWSDVLGKFEEIPISVTGLDGHFILWAAIFLFSIPLFLWATRKAQKFQVKTKSQIIGN